MKIKLPFLIISIFVILSFVYFHFSFSGQSTDKVYITITTFFFSIFSGFFVTRQGSRYTKIREIISTYDGKMSGIYRVSGNLSKEAQLQIGEIILAHYQKIIETRSWDYHFINKSSTITKIHAVLESLVGDNKQETLRNQSVGKIIGNTGDLQVLRKNMIMLSQEKIPAFQWTLLLFFVGILILTVSVLPSGGLILESVLKSAFAVSVISVILILYNLDNLHLFEKFIGENSAEDVVETIKSGK